MGKRVNAAQHAEDASRLERRLRAFELKKRGWSLRDIGKDIGVNHQTVANYIKETCREYLTPVAEEYRAQLLSEIDDQLARLYGYMAKPQYVTSARGDVVHGPDGEPILDREYYLKIEDRIARQLDQRSKLVGAFAPAQVEATVHEVTQADVELQAIIREARAKRAAQGTSEGAGREQQPETDAVPKHDSA